MCTLKLAEEKAPERGMEAESISIPMHLESHVLCRQSDSGRWTSLLGRHHGNFLSQNKKEGNESPLPS